MVTTETSETKFIASDGRKFTSEAQATVWDRVVQAHSAMQEATQVFLREVQNSWKTADGYELGATSCNLHHVWGHRHSQGGGQAGVREVSWSAIDIELVEPNDWQEPSPLIKVRWLPSGEREEAVLRCRPGELWRSRKLAERAALKRARELHAEGGESLAEWAERLES